MANFLKWTSKADADPRAKKRKRSNSSLEKPAEKRVKLSTVLGWKLDYLEIVPSPCGIYVEKIKCKICSSYPDIVKAFSNPGDNSSDVYIEGTTVIKKCNAENHAKNKGHNKAEEKYSAIYVGKTPVGQSIGDVFSSMNKNETEMIIKLFDISYYLAKQELPFSLFANQIELEKRHGVTLGETYANDKACKTFTMCIAETLKDDLKLHLKNSRYISFLTDGSTDRSQKEKELIYVKFLKCGKPITAFAGMIDLHSADAKGIKSALEKVLETELNVDIKSHIVAGGADGASVNFGSKSGLMKLIKDEVPWLVPIHCAAHRLELGVKDGLQTSTVWKKIENILIYIRSHFKRSPKRWRDFQMLAEILNEKVVKPSEVGGTRWLPHKQRALAALKKNYCTLVSYFNDVVASHESSDSVNTAKIQGYLKRMTSYSFVSCLAFYSDVVNILSHFSNILQKDNLNVSSLSDAFEVCKKSLISLVENHDGECYGTFEKELEIKEDGTYYCSIKLNNLQIGKETVKKQHKYVMGIIEALEKRFTDLHENEILKCASIFDPANWSEENNYGVEELNFLTNHFKDILLLNNCIIENVPLQWQDVKHYVRKYHSKADFLNLWEKIFTYRSEEFKDFLHLAEIVLILPLSTSVVERIFSVMKRVKSDWRSSLNEDTLSALIRIIADGPTLLNFQANRAVQKWFDACDRRPCF